MRAARSPTQRPPDARLLVVGPDGSLRHTPRSRLPDFLRAGDLLVANDAATMPASLASVHVPSGERVEIRLAGRRSLRPVRTRAFTALAFGVGDHRTCTEDRPPPPPLAPGDRLLLGPLEARIERRLGHPRLIDLRFAGTLHEIWAGIARHGRPIQYAHLPEPLALWDVWTRVAALPVAFEPPSAGFLLDWRLLAGLAGRGIGFRTLTLAAGLSSTGDPALDARLPLDEPYRLPETTARAVGRVRARGGAVVALGTTVARALEHAALTGSLRAGEGVATGRLGADSTLRVVDGIVTGVHQPGESHYELLRAFAPDEVLLRAVRAAEGQRYRTHEFGDSMFVEPRPRAAARRCPGGRAPRRARSAPTTSGSATASGAARPGPPRRAG